MNFYTVLRKFFGYLIPATCVGCGKFGVNICDRCIKSIQANERQVCPNCRAKSDLGLFCSAPCKEKFLNGYECFLDGILVCCVYEKDGSIEKLITRFKYKFSDEIKNIICPLLSNFAFEFKELDFDFVVPVPLHSKREKMRSFNQSEILTNAVTTAIGARKQNILIRKYNTFPQAKLNRKGRLVNLTNAFDLKLKGDQIPADIYNKKILIIDDVCTTGSTLNECAKALQKLRPNKIYGLVLARG